MTPPQSEPPHRKRREPVSLADIRAFGTWQLGGVRSFGSDLDSPGRLREKMRRRSEQVLGRILHDEPSSSSSPSPPPPVVRADKRATYDGLGIGVAEKVSFRTARSNVVRLRGGGGGGGGGARAASLCSWSESATSSPLASTPTRAGGVARPLILTPSRALPGFLAD